MTNRSETMSAFLQKSGWGDAQRVLVAGDASNRRYDRLTQDGHSVILMDAPPDKGEDVRPFIKISQHLKSLGLSAPMILHHDTNAGFLVIEDLGDDLFAKVLAADPTLEDTLYRAATDVLIELHRAPLPHVAAYDVPFMTDMAALAYDWYGAQATGQECSDQSAAFRSAVQPVLKAHTGGPQVLIQRDYHAENLLWLPDRDGIARVGLLDFQDAMSGHPAYDLVSVLQDARRDVSEHTEQDMIAYYVSQSGADESAFKTAYAVLGAQRNLRIIGVFTRLCVRDGKASYIDLIPRVWGLLIRDLLHPALKDVAKLVLKDLPAPTPAVLERIKAKCPTLQAQ